MAMNYQRGHIKIQLQIEKIASFECQIQLVSRKATQVTQDIPTALAVTTVSLATEKKKI